MCRAKSYLLYKRAVVQLFDGGELICPSLGQLRNLPVSYVHSMNLTWHKLRPGSHKIHVLI